MDDNKALIMPKVTDKVKPPASKKEIIEAMAQRKMQQVIDEREELRQKYAPGADDVLDRAISIVAAMNSIKKAKRKRQGECIGGKYDSMHNLITQEEGGASCNLPEAEAR